MRSSHEQQQHMSTLMSLGQRQRIAFAASCCERLLPNYYACTVIEQHGDIRPLEVAMDHIWRYVQGEGTIHEQIQEDITACERCFIDIDQRKSIFATLADDALSAILYTLKTIVHDDFQYVQWICDIVDNTLDAYLFSVNDPTLTAHRGDPDLEVWLQASPLWAAEYAQQQHDITFLQAKQHVTAEMVYYLRQKATNVGIWPAKRGLIASIN